MHEKRLAPKQTKLLLTAGAISLPGRDEDGSNFGHGLTLDWPGSHDKPSSKESSTTGSNALARMQRPAPKVDVVQIRDVLSGQVNVRKGAGELSDLVKGVTEQVFRHDVMGLSAETAYHGLLAFFPFLLFVAATVGFLSFAIDTQQVVDEIVGQLEGTAPEDTSSALKDLFDDLVEARRPELLILGGGLAIWSGSNAVSALIKGMNRIQETEDNTEVVGRRFLAFGFLFMFLVVALAGQALIQGVGFLTQDLGFFLRGLFSTLAWLATLVLLVTTVGVFYRYAPEKRSGGSELVTVGGLVFALFWLGGTAVYTIYLRVGGGPQSIFGLIGVVMLLMVWFYISAFAVLVGAEVDRYLGKRLGKDRKKGAAAKAR